MALKGECVNDDMTTCFDCGEPLELKVCESNAGFYLGFDCPNCGPYSRESNYFKHKETAEMCLISGIWNRRGDR